MSAAVAEALARDMTERLRDALAGTAGTSAMRIETYGSWRSIAVHIMLEGWSPTLHAKAVRHENSFDAGDEGVVLSRTTTEAAVDLIAAVQRARAEDAARLGRSTPFPTSEIGHVSVDRGIAELRGDGPDATRRAVHEALRRAHSEAKDYRGGHRLEAGGTLLGESRAADGSWIRLCAPNVRIMGSDGRRRATLRGFDLDIETGHLPDTVLTAVVGRPLGDLARLHPALDGRIVRRAANRTGKARPGVVVTIDLEVDPIDAVLGGAVLDRAA